MVDSNKQTPLNELENNNGNQENQEQSHVSSGESEKGGPGSEEKREGSGIGGQKQGRRIVRKQEQGRIRSKSGEGQNSEPSGRSQREVPEVEETSVKVEEPVTTESEDEGITSSDTEGPTEQEVIWAREEIASIEEIDGLVSTLDRKDEGVYQDRIANIGKVGTCTEDITFNDVLISQSISTTRLVAVLSFFGLVAIDFISFGMIFDNGEPLLGSILLLATAPLYIATVWVAFLAVSATHSQEEYSLYPRRLGEMYSLIDDYESKKDQEMKGGSAN